MPIVCGSCRWPRLSRRPAAVALVAEIPEHMIVIGSGVTGVEFTHLFDALGSKVTLLVSRQQVLPAKDPEVAAVLEEDFLGRGVRLLKGARAVGLDRTDTGDLIIRCDDGRSVER